MTIDTIDVNPKESDFGLPIIVALPAEHWDRAKKMITHPTFNPLAKTNKGTTYLHTAMQSGSEAVGIASLLISKGVDINARYYDGTTALHLACLSGNTDMVQLLVEKGADINAVNHLGESMLRQAVKAKSPEILNYLRENGINCNLRANGQTALDKACEAKNVPAIESLLPYTKLDLKDCLKGSTMSNAMNHCSMDTKKKFLAQSLGAYLHDRMVNPIFMADPLSYIGFGFSKQDKLDAAQAFLNYIQDSHKNPLDIKHIPVLKQGRLRDLYDFYIANRNDLLKPAILQKAKEFKNEYQSIVANHSSSFTENTEVTKELTLGK